MASSRGSLSTDIKQESLVLDFCGGYIDLKYMKRLGKKLAENEGVCIEELEIIKAPSKMLKPIVRALALNKTLKMLKICDSVTDVQAKWIAAAMKSNTTLRLLDLSNNKITCEGVLRLQPLLRDGKLKTFRLYKNALCPKGGDMQIAKALQNNTTMINLGHIFHIDDPADERFRVLMMNRNLIVLTFYDVVGRVGREVLQQRDNLEYLTLGNTKNLGYIAEGLKNNRSVLNLDLISYQPHPPQGLEEFGKALSENVTLKRLSIRFKKIRLDMDALLKGVTSNTTLERLHLDFKIDDIEELEKKICSKFPGLIEIEYGEDC